MSAIRSLTAEREGCTSCGLTEEDARWVAAVVHRCPTCEDLDRRAEEIPKDSRHGQRVRFDHLDTLEESVQESSHAFYTIDGATERTRADRMSQGPISGQ